MNVPPPPVPFEVDCRTVKTRLDAKAGTVLVDCRERDEHRIVCIADAVLLPMSELAARVGELAPYRQSPIVVHCHHGGRSLRVTEWLREQGFSHVQSMAGGIDQWAVQIDPSLPRY
jgi:rhodanese-related sulfurtransferase